VDHHAALLELDVRIAGAERRRQPPGGRRPQPVQHPGLGQQERAGAGGGDRGTSGARRGDQLPRRQGPLATDERDQRIGLALPREISSMTLGVNVGASKSPLKVQPSGSG